LRRRQREPGILRELLGLVLRQVERNIEIAGEELGGLGLRIGNGQRVQAPDLGGDARRRCSS
jgi:hypothetical protein